MKYSTFFSLGLLLIAFIQLSPKIYPENQDIKRLEKQKIKSIKKTFFVINANKEIRVVPSLLKDLKDLGTTYFDKEGRKIKYEKQLKNDSVLNTQTWSYNRNGTIEMEVDYKSFGKYMYDYNAAGNLIKKVTFDKKDSLKYTTLIEYKDTLKIKESSVASDGRHVISYIWEYDSKGILISSNQSFRSSFNPKDKKYYNYDDSGNKIELYKKNEKRNKLKLIEYKYNNKKELLKITYYSNNKQTSEINYTYDIHGNYSTTERIKHYSEFEHIDRKEYLRNSKGDLIQRITYDFKKGAKIASADKIIETYKYVYDRYDNWIEKESYTTIKNNSNIIVEKSTYHKENGRLKTKTYRNIEYY